MTSISGESRQRPRAHADMGEVALATGVVAALRSLGTTSVARTTTGIATTAGVSLGLGALAGVAGEGGARLLDAATGLDRFQSHVAVGGAGLAAALIGRHVPGTGGALAASVGAVLAVTAGAGAALDLAHARFDTDDDGRFLPQVPLAVKVGIGALTVGAIGLKYGKQAVSAAANAKQLAGSAAEVDAAGAALNELIPRSKLTIGPKVFLGGRMSDGLAATAKRVVMPHKLDAPELRTALGLPATGDLTPDQLASIAIRSMEQQGAYAVDDAGRAMVDAHFMGSPTGMGGLNLAPVMTAEDLVRSATFDAQYGAKPSVQSLGKIDEANEAFVAMASAHKARLSQLPATAQAPTYGIATSLGGLQFGKLVETRGPQVLDELGLAKIITLGAPVEMSKLDPSKLPEGFHIRATFEEFAGLSDEAVANARFIELYNAGDPVSQISAGMLIKRPAHFAADRRFTPVVSAVQQAVDITTAISRGTGPTISSGGHEYRSVVSNSAFARALSLPGISDEAILAAARRAEVSSVAEAKRAREVLMGVKPAPVTVPRG